MSNYDRFQKLEAQGVDLVELLAGDRTMLTDEFVNIVNQLGSVGDELYSDLLFLLAHRRFEQDQARRVWHGILKHKRKLTARLERDPGIRVAALDYLTNVRALMNRPRIVDRVEFEELVSHVNIDELTGLYNRRHTKNAYHHELRRARRYSKAFTAMLIDIDNFKGVNDTYGHAAGDQVLCTLADLLRSVCRETDIIGRHGGDELMVLLPEAKKTDAFALGERIRRSAREAEVSVAGHAQPVRFSISIGLATYPEDSQEGAELIRFADEALYASKRRGRDVVSIYERDPSAPRETGSQAAGG